MNRILRTVIASATMLVATGAAAQVTFYQDDGFRGRSFTADHQVGNFERFGFNDRASSVVVRGGAWEVCEDARFGGRCVVLRPGRYRSLNEVGLNDRISSVRPADAQANRHDDRRERAYDDRNNRYDRNNQNEYNPHNAHGGEARM